MLSLNAARDLVPRIMAALLGFGKMAFPVPRADIWVTTLVPVVGAIAATFFYDYVMLPYFPKPKAK